MKRSALAGLAVLAAVACRTESNLAPSDPLAPGISFDISDGAHGGNVTFYFLPPMVPDPGDVGGTFNPDAHPTVSICQRDPANTTCVGTPTVFTDVKVSGDHYHQNWKSPKSAPANTIWRVSVLVGSIELGFADVKNAKNVDPNEFVGINAGQTLPIKFLIQTPEFESACTSSPCSEGTIGATGGTVFFEDDGETIGGVTIPAQPGRGPFSVTIQYCSSPADIQVDIPVFGSCLAVLVRDANGEVTSENENELTVPGEVFVCNADDDPDLPAGAQGDLVTLHREHSPGNVKALPHSLGSCPVVVGSLGGFVRALVHGHWKRAGQQLLGALSPTPLYARRLDEGAGGQTAEFSNFQFALPSEMEKLGGDNQSGEFGTTLPSPLEVLVTDLLNQPVQGATVHFAPTPGSGSVSAAAVVTGPDGIAAVSWTLPAPTEQDLKVEATGFGIASEDCDPETESCTDISGPRPGRDPFQPIQDAFDDCSEACPPLVPTPLETGKLTFRAFGFSCDGPCSTASLLAAPNTRIRPIDLMVGPPRGKASQPAKGPLPKAGKRVNQ